MKEGGSGMVLIWEGISQAREGEHAEEGEGGEEGRRSGSKVGECFGTNVLNKMSMQPMATYGVYTAICFGK